MTTEELVHEIASVVIGIWNDNTGEPWHDHARLRIQCDMQNALTERYVITGIINEPLLLKINYDVLTAMCRIYISYKTFCSARTQIIIKDNVVNYYGC